MKDMLRPVKARHFAAVTADELPAFLAAMDKKDARLFKPMRIALRLLMLVFVRSSKLIEMPWSEIDLEKGEWIIPGRRMKRAKLAVNLGTTDHHPCLSRQALDLLPELHELTGGGKLADRPSPPWR